MLGMRGAHRRAEPSVVYCDMKLGAMTWKRRCVYEILFKQTRSDTCADNVQKKNDPRRVRSSVLYISADGTPTCDARARYLTAAQLFFFFPLSDL